MTKQAGPRVVFVVEDDESMREAIENLLCVAGFSAVVYESAEAMLAEINGDRPLCVISDLNLPAMSGLDLLIECVAEAGHRRSSSLPPMIRHRLAEKPSDSAPRLSWPNRFQALRC